MNMINLAGQRFGRLAVISRAENNKTGQAYWFCQCECGTVKKVRGTHLTGNQVVSCGCHAKELNTHHGKYGSPEYRAYYNMIKRCEYQKDISYQDYGGRGIRVCPAWRQSFEQFFRDMGLRPSNRHSLDRINVNGNYEPQNCRWAVVETQERNKRVRKDSPTGVRGVVLNTRTGKYVAQIYSMGKTKRIGTFETLNEALDARQVAEKKYWGDVNHGCFSSN